MTKPTQVSFNRRAFLKSALLAGATTAGSGLLTGCAAQSSRDVSWNEETDVIVVGGGGTGLAAAISAAEDGGASVILLEKGVAVGGSTSISGGVVQAAGTTFQQEVGVTGDTPERHAQYWLEAGEGIPDPDLVELLANSAPETLDWLIAHGLSYVTVYGVSPIPTVEEDLMVPRIHVPGGRGEVAQSGTGEVHIEALNEYAQNLDIDMRLQSAATALIVDDNNVVVGVKADVNGQETFFRALRGVVLATGGIDHNEEMARAFSPQQLWELETGQCFCTPNNTGDGIRMAMAIGSDLAGLGGTVGVPSVTMGADALNQALDPIPGIWVNKHGQRFVNEGAHYAYVIRAVFQQEDHMAWAIFDENVRSLGGTVLGGIWGAWSEDLSDEIASGKVVAGETIEELAEAIGVNATHLRMTLEGWNDDTAAGEDTLFGKEVGLQPLDQAPYYATLVTSVNLGTCGGVKINTDCQVIDTNGTPISRLYAGGMNAGGFIGPYYPGSGTAVMATAVFGRIAGRNAAGEEPLT